jgi:tRNA(Ile)-lysidine synthase
MAHGSGLEGLRGMDYLSEIGELKIVRPLLGVDPAELHRVVEGAGLEAVSDPSNGDLDYERVRWRQVLPQLAALGLDAKRLAKLADRMRDADRALESMASEAFAEVAVSNMSAAIEIDRGLLMRLPHAVVVRVIGRALGEAGGWQKRHALGAVEVMTDKLIHGPVRATLHGCLIRSDGKIIRIAREPGRAAVSRTVTEPSDA